MCKGKQSFELNLHIKAFYKKGPAPNLTGKKFEAPGQLAVAETYDSSS
jgi:hypothetical protein